MAMTTLQRNTLNKTLEVLPEDFDVIPAIIHFKSKGIFTEGDEENIIAKVTKKEKVMEFVTTIEKKGTEAYSIFYEYLKNCPGSQHLAKEPERKSREGIPEKINILLIGKTGSGKSATGNTIIGSSSFQAACSSQSVTRTIDKKVLITEKGIKITVIDTPGLFDTAKCTVNETIQNEDLMLEIAKTMISFNAGIHLFLLIYSSTVRFTKEEQETIKAIEKILGKDIYSNCVVILTNARAQFGGNKMEPLKDYVKREIETGGKFAELLAQVKGNIIAVENCFDDNFLEENIARNFFVSCSRNLKPFLTSQTVSDLEKLEVQIKQGKVPAEIITQVSNNLSTEQKELLGEDAIEREIVKQLTEQSQLIEECRESAKKCFAGSTKVSIKLRGNAKISNVKVGDEILVYDENGHLFYDKVYLFSHAIEDESITFIRLKTSSGKELFISPGHLLPAGSLCRNVSATDISIGDIIFTLQNSEMTSDTVTSITYELCRGAYCPMTMHGTIVVNDVAASCYTTFFPARLAHVLLSPIRFLFGYLPLHLFNGLFPYDAEEGMPILLLRCRNMITTWRSF
ncbi:hypothetical protein BSL78_04600 [Apostichopus japonicus]|uniref:AIG1-type G domain-containing protein n=1 Tax=Stichopus japonicus TaxID=307972 RepID=A0A2G8LE16_STIJA|nr:hypothetical protein BSL78_04600 [Apostichopus japonicus]